MRNECFALEILQGERFDLSVGGEVRKIEVHVLSILFGAVHEDDRERIALVADGTVGGHQRVVAGGGLHTIRVAVAAEQVHRFVHAVAPGPRGENLDTVILHSAEKRRIDERCHHRIRIVQVGFGNAERNAVILAEVLFEPVVDAYEDVRPVAFLLVAPVAFACGTAHTVSALVVVSGIEQHTVPIDAAFVIFFARVPVDVEHVEESHAASLFCFGDFLGEKFQPAVFLAIDLGSAFFVVGVDVAPLPFVCDHRAGELDVAPGGAGLLGDIDVAFNEKVSRDRQIQVGMRAAPDFHFVIHAPVLETAHVELKFVFPVRDNRDGRVGGPFHIVERGVARLDQRLAVFGNFSAAREVECLRRIRAVLLFPVPVGEIVFGAAGCIARELEGVHRVDPRHVVENLLRGNRPIVRVDVVEPVRVNRHFVAPVVARGVVAVVRA